MLRANIKAVKKAIAVKRDTTDHTAANSARREPIEPPQTDILAAIILLLLFCGRVEKERVSSRQLDVNCGIEVINCTVILCKCSR